MFGEPGLTVKSIKINLFVIYMIEFFEGLFQHTMFSIFINILVSIVLIYCIHLAWTYIKDNYSTKKTKDLVNSQIKKYKQMVDEIQNSRTFVADTGSPNTGFISKKEIQSLDEELTRFIESQV